jgi:ethanolamine transporter EutH
MHFITTTIGPSIQKAIHKYGLTAVDAGGLIACFAAAVPMYRMYDNMTRRGMVFGAAFQVGAAYAIDDPMIVVKLFAGIVALVMAVFSADMFVRKGQEAHARMRAEEDQNHARKRRESSSELDSVYMKMRAIQ